GVDWTTLLPAETQKYITRVRERWDREEPPAPAGAPPTRVAGEPGPPTLEFDDPLLEPERPVGIPPVPPGPTTRAPAVSPPAGLPPRPSLRQRLGEVLTAAAQALPLLALGGVRGPKGPR